MTNFLKPEKNPLQQRGHCQCCGRLQATDSLTMSHHGYTKRHGWFEGVCGGRNFQPIEMDRRVADKTVADVRRQCEQLKIDAIRMEGGEIDPEFVESRKGPLRFSELPEYRQTQERQNLASQMRYRHNEGIRFAQYLEDITNAWHGKPLTVVTKAPPTEYIEPGEVRIGRTNQRLTCSRREGGRVYFTTEKGLKSWIGTRAWRSLKKG